MNTRLEEIDGLLANHWIWDIVGDCDDCRRVLDDFVRLNVERHELMRKKQLDNR